MKDALKMTTKLVGDKRERNINDILQPDETSQLNIGDFMVCVNDNPILYIERKTADDLVASIKDGRYREQKERLSQVRHLYIIEDEAPLAHTEQLVVSTILSISARDQHPIIISRSMEETAQWLKQLKLKVENDTKRFLNGANDNSITYTTPNDRITPDNAIVHFLCQIPGVSQQTAKSIQQTYTSLSDLVQRGNLEDISSIKIQSSGKRIGKKIAQRVIQYVQN